LPAEIRVHGVFLHASYVFSECAWVGFGVWRTVFGVWVAFCRVRGVLKDLRVGVALPPGGGSATLRSALLA